MHYPFHINEPYLTEENSKASTPNAEFSLIVRQIRKTPISNPNKSRPSPFTGAGIPVP